MNRRFVNLVLADYGTRMHSLFRLDVAKHLFYPSTAQAEAANAKQERNNGGGGGVRHKPKWPKPPRINWLRPLPEPSMRFFPFPPADDGDGEPDPWPSNDDAFMLLRPGSSEGTILHATEGGRTVIYDADARAISATMPTFDTGMGHNPIVFSVPGTGGFMQKKESLYIMRSTIKSPVHDCYSSPNNKDEDRCSGDFVVLNFNQPFNWQPLPRPPFVDKGPVGSQFHIRSSAVVDGGRTICVSSEIEGGVKFTYCFDTATQQWRHAGDWALPFDGRAEYVPELGTWIGLSSTPPHHLCATDLSAMDAHRAPMLQHVWDDFTPPLNKESSVMLNQRFPRYVLRRTTEWLLDRLSLVHLGSGRFCILKVFKIRRSEWIGFHQHYVPDEEPFSVLTGVEVVPCNDGELGLRMVKHKSKRFLVTGVHWLL